VQRSVRIGLLGAMVGPLLAAGAAFADDVVLTNGRVIENCHAEVLADGSVRVVLGGGSATFRPEQVQSVVRNQALESAPALQGRDPGPYQAHRQAYEQRLSARPMAPRGAQADQVRLVSPEDHALHAIAQAVRSDYAEGQRELARQRIEAEPRLVAWEDAGDLVEISCAFQQRGSWSGVELTLRRREGVQGPLAVAFPPGSFARPDLQIADDGRRPPTSQQLLFLRAPVIEVPTAEELVVARVPVACGNLGIPGPRSGQAHHMTQLTRGTDVDRLMQILCSGAGAPDECEAQLAVWIVRNQVGPGVGLGYTTFESSRSIDGSHGPGARRAIEAAGVDAQGLPFFRDQAPGPQRVAPRRQQRVEPELELEPHEQPQVQPRPEPRFDPADLS
jgi:hypothetical protein